MEAGVLWEKQKQSGNSLQLYLHIHTHRGNDMGTGAWRRKTECRGEVVRCSLNW